MILFSDFRPLRRLLVVVEARIEEEYVVTPWGKVVGTRAPDWLQRRIKFFYIFLELTKNIIYEIFFVLL